MNFIKTFNERTREKVWNKYQDEMKLIFRYTLNRLKDLDLRYIPEGLMPPKVMEQRVYRLEIGYNGIGRGNGIPSGIRSTESHKFPTSKSTDDHIIGATECGKTVHDVFKKSGYDIDYMVNEWLYEHLYLWATVKILKEEHKSYNVLRNSNHTLEEKLNLEHYINVSPLI